MSMTRTAALKVMVLLFSPEILIMRCLCPKTNCASADLESYVILISGLITYQFAFLWLYIYVIITILDPYIRMGHKRLPRADIPCCAHLARADWLNKKINFLPCVKQGLIMRPSGKAPDSFPHTCMTHSVQKLPLCRYERGCTAPIPRFWRLSSTMLSRSPILVHTVRGTSRLLRTSACGNRQAIFRLYTSLARRYYPIGVDHVEDIEEYRPGGYHPVHLGDILDGRYKILHKLGCGGLSTTWLARDQVGYHALKILKADETVLSTELKTL